MPGASSMRGVTGFRVARRRQRRARAAAPRPRRRPPARAATRSRSSAPSGRTASGSSSTSSSSAPGAARRTADGNDGLTNPASLAANIPVEVAESEFPIVVERYGLVPDSGGAGLHRGGLAIERVWRCLTPRTSLIVRSDRAEHAAVRPRGRRPGRARRATCSLHPDGSEEMLPPMFSIEIERGRRLRPPDGGRRRLGRPARARPGRGRRRRPEREGQPRGGAGALRGRDPVKITAVTATPIALPLEQPFHWRSGVQAGVNLVLFAVETDEGVTGYGESICEDPAAVESYGRADGARVRRPLARRHRGDPRRALARRPLARRPPLLAPDPERDRAACWDALGKGLGVPASTFLGGRVHDEVDFMAFPQGDTAEELAREAAALAAEGHRVVYIKVGRAQRDDARGRRRRARRDRAGAAPARRPERGAGTCRARSTRSGGSRSSTSTGSSSRCAAGNVAGLAGCGARSRRRSPPTRPCTRPPSSAPCSSRRRRTRSCSAATSRAASGGGGRWRTSPSRTGSR